MIGSVQVLKSRLSLRRLIELADAEPKHLPAVYDDFGRPRQFSGNRNDIRKALRCSEGLTWYEWHRVHHDQTPHAAVHRLRLRRHAQPLCARPGRQGLQAVRPRSSSLPADATEDDHLALLGLLNSSTACFWMKQVFITKASIRGSEVSMKSERGKILRVCWNTAANGIHSRVHTARHSMSRC